MGNDRNRLLSLEEHISESSGILGLRSIPHIVVEKRGPPNARTNLSKILITTSALDIFTEEEQFAIIDHELGHISNKYKDWIFYAYLMLPFIAFMMLMWIGLSVLPVLSTMVLLFSLLLFVILRFPLNQRIIKLKRRSEFEADRISAKLGNKGALISALLKLKPLLNENEGARGSYHSIVQLIFRFYFSKNNVYPSIEERIERLEVY